MKELSILELITIKNDCLQMSLKCQSDGAGTVQEFWDLRCEKIQSEIELRYQSIFDGGQY